MNNARRKMNGVLCGRRTLYSLQYDDAAMWGVIWRFAHEVGPDAWVLRHGYLYCRLLYFTWVNDE